MGGLGHLGIDPDVNIRRIEARVSAGEGRDEARRTRTTGTFWNFFMIVLLLFEIFIRRFALLITSVLVARQRSLARAARGFG